LIVGKAEGNPFYLEEVIRSLIDQGMVTAGPDGTGWQMAAEVEEITIPDTLQGVIMARVDGLGPALKRALQVASVIGRSFHYDVLARVIGEE
jgi:predicted ATPase